MKSVVGCRRGTQASQSGGELLCSRSNYPAAICIAFDGCFLPCCSFFTFKTAKNK